MNSKLTDKLMSGLKDLDFKPTGKENIDQGERLVSTFAGSYLLYKSLMNLGKNPLLSLSGIAAGGLLLYRGATGVCPVYQRLGKDTTDPQAININEDIVVNAPRDRVYAIWRNLSNLPKFMTHLKSVEELDGETSVWKANLPGGIVALEWNASITREDEGNYLGWQSVEDSMIDNAGKIEFRDTLSGTGTEIHIEIDYFPPAGSVGRGVTMLFNGLFERIIREDVQNFKKYVESEEMKRFVGVSL